MKKTLSELLSKERKLLVRKDHLEEIFLLDADHSYQNGDGVSWVSDNELEYDRVVEKLKKVRKKIKKALKKEIKIRKDMS